MMKTIKIALVGNPNCGKTTLYNALTGSVQYVGNWPGVTVEKKEGKLRKIFLDNIQLKGFRNIVITDLPGIYSLSPYSCEEIITRDYLCDGEADVIIDIVDASNIERNLYLTTQLQEVGIPVVVALNMMDIVDKRGIKIDGAKLSAMLGCPVTEISAAKGKGVSKLVTETINASTTHHISAPMHYSSMVERYILQISGIIKDITDLNRPTRYVAIKLLEHDDEISRNISTKISHNVKNMLEQKLKEWDEKIQPMADSGEEMITSLRYRQVQHITENCVDKSKERPTLSDRIDNVVTNRYLAFPIFAAIMLGVYYIAVSLLGKHGSAYLGNWFAGLGTVLSGWMEQSHCAIWLRRLVVEGLYGGITSVLCYVPQLAALFALLTLLEDCGYMSRIAFIMDRVFKKIGLSGKSFIPMLVGTGCSVPGIMASRTIENPKDRKMTIILTPFIPCGAKIPVFVVMASSLFPGNPMLVPLMYVLGVLIVVICGSLLKGFAPFKGEHSPFVMELPSFHVPRPKNVLIHVWDRVKAFIVKAGTVIFIASGVVWILGAFDFRFHMADTSQSMLASIGKAVAPIFAPLGFGTWQATVALLTGIIAKEQIVATMGILYSGTQEVPLTSAISTVFTKASALAFMVFVLLAAPCSAALATTKKELGTTKATVNTAVFQTVVAYCVAFIVYQFSRIILK